MTLTITDDNGNERIERDVLAYSLICEDDISANELDLEISLTDEQKKEVIRRADRMEYFPSNWDDLRTLMLDVYEGR